MTIKIGILGYGNLGRGVELAIDQQKDMELVAVFSRRDPQTVQAVSDQVRVESIENILDYQDQMDVLILCGGSATDLPEQTPEFTQFFNTVDSFDNHSAINDHYNKVDAVAKAKDTVSIISVGWDPGLFSLNRLLAEAVLPTGQSYTFWGKGLSQGHSDAVRRVDGVKAAVQYTVPDEAAMAEVRAGEAVPTASSATHQRICYVVLEEGANPQTVETTIKTMPAYFADYQTTVHFISQEELDRDHSGMPHGGHVIHSAYTGENQEHLQSYEFKLALQSNPEFTASVLVAYTRAAYRLAQTNSFGCYTAYDVAPGLLSPKSAEELRGSIL